MNSLGGVAIRNFSLRKLIIIIIVTTIAVSWLFQDKLIIRILVTFLSFFFFTANSIEILMGCHNRLVQPRLASNQSLSGRILKRIFTQRTIYIRPERQLLEIDHTVSNYFNTVSIIFTYSECIHGVKKE